MLAGELGDGLGMLVRLRRDDSLLVHLLLCCTSVPSCRGMYILLSLLHRRRHVASFCWIWVCFLGSGIALANRVLDVLIQIQILIGLSMKCISSQPSGLPTGLFPLFFAHEQQPKPEQNQQRWATNLTRTSYSQSTCDQKSTSGWLTGLQHITACSFCPSLSLA